MLHNPTGPTLLGFDVIWVGTVLAGVAAIAVMFAIYTAITVRDPMAKRVKALNERREQLKAGIVSTSKKRASLVRKSDATDMMKETLSSLKVLQDSQLKIIQQKLAQAGIRKKELAFAVLFARLVLPIVLGSIMVLLIFVLNSFPDWSAFKKVLAFGAAIGLGYKGPEIYLSNIIGKRTKSIRQGLPDANLAVRTLSSAMNLRSPLSKCRSSPNAATRSRTSPIVSIWNR
jgi:tight adherence protein C